MPEPESAHDTEYQAEIDPNRCVEIFLANYNVGHTKKWKEDVQQLKKWIDAPGKSSPARKEVVLEIIAAELATYDHDHRLAKDWEAKNKPALQWLKREIADYQQYNP